MKSTSSINQNSYINQTTDTNDILANFDFTEIEEKDPSLSEGHKLLYDREVPFELRLEDNNGPQEVASFEALRCKILLGGVENNPIQIRIELSCENDLFFHFTSDIDEETFKIMQENQKLTVNFSEFSNLVKKLFNNCINEPQSYIAVFIMQKEGTARLDFIQNIEYKFIELLSIDFVNSPDDTVRKQISYRYNAIRTKLELVQNRIQAISNIVKIKNPSLLLQIQKAPAKLNMSTKSGNFTNK
jgi:cold shock CspA family protein